MRDQPGNCHLRKQPGSGRIFCRLNRETSSVAARFGKLRFELSGPTTFDSDERHVPVGRHPGTISHCGWFGVNRAVLLLVAA